MIERRAWTPILVMALMCSWVEPARCLAQSPASPSSPISAERSASPAPRPAQPQHLPATTEESALRILPPRAWTNASSTSRVPPPRPWPAAVSTSAADPMPPSARATARSGLPPLSPRSTERSVRPLPLLRSSSSPVLAQQERAPAGSVPVGPAMGPDGQNLPSSTPRTGLPPSPEEQVVNLKAAPLEASDLRFPINLATALRLADARPLIVAAAQASVWVAEAQLTRAKVLWVPSIMTGADYIRHDGGGPDINKGVMTASSVNFFYGGTGLYNMVNVTDVLFEPLAARQVLNSRQWDIQTAKNDALLMTADAYFNVHRYRGMYAGALYAVERGHALVEKISNLSRDLVPAVEVDRARNMVADLEQQATSAREAWRVHSANLTQVLRLDPRSVVVPLEHDHLQITLIDPGLSLHDLQKIAVTNRPELASRRALVQAAETRVRREKNRPLLPLVLLNGFQSAGMYYQIGIFGIGPNSSMNQWWYRSDPTIQLAWQLEGFGVGNLSRIKQQRGEESRAFVDLYKAQDTVVAEVTAAQAHLQSATDRVMQADRALRTGIITFNGHLEGLGQTTRFENLLIMVYRPQEAVYSLELLKVALDEYFSTVAQYNRAQFELFHALGYPANEVTNLRHPGDIIDVDTSRPAYLPPVGNGPPPATR